MKSILLLTILTIPVIVYAGGPRHVDGNTPVRYTNPNVTLNFDVGTLGARTNSEANDFVIQSMALWNDVTTSTINLSQSNNLSTDIDHTNYQNLLFPVGGGISHPSLSDGQNPVIYDINGQLIDDFIGAGSSNVIVGLATSVFTPGTGSYTTGYVLLNGKNPIDTTPVSDARLSYTIAHEIGHMIGLDHSQLNMDDNNKNCALAGDKYPVMYPVFCGQPSNVLHPDDVAAISAQYPEQNVTSTFGEINGTLVDPAGNHQAGLNIFVTNQQSGEVYSVVSDYLKQGTGFFSMLLPAGTYTLRAKNIVAEFKGLSSVGPYATNASDTSFNYGTVVINFTGTTPASNELLTVTTGEATTVSMVIDGSGTFTTGNTMTLNSTTNDSNNSSGGMLSPVMLLFMLIGLFRRAFSHKKYNYSDTFLKN